METVNFITTEIGDDLIVSFAVAGDDPVDVISLTLLRTPKFEFILDSDERGVNISRDDIPEWEQDMLASVHWAGTNVRIGTRFGRHYTLDVRRVSDDEVQQAKQILRRMNVDHAFKLALSER
jgi:hypothetical protein